jgi:hypothetical protein
VGKFLLLWRAHTGTGVQGAERVIPLEPVSSSLTPDLADKWPYLAGCSVLRVPADALKQV